MTNNNTNTLFVLGAGDPEMEAIEAALKASEVSYVYATNNGGRCHPGSAYRADPVDGATHWVECAPIGGKSDFDHHNPGDRGYGVGPEGFFEASSLGQVLNWLGVTPSQEQVICAAADHCLSAAYEGRCQGVTPNDLMLWRATSKAKFQKTDVQSVLAAVEAAKQELEKAPLLGEVRDMRREEPVKELPEAAARYGYSYVSGPLKCPDGRRKFTASSSKPEIIRLWMTETAPAMGLVDIYGDPARGFAGGYEA